MELTKTEKRLDELFNELVPSVGKADTVAGEIVRAICRIVYRYYNDGDRIGIGYGKRTCNPSARYLMNFGGDIENAVIGLWSVFNEDDYGAYLRHLEQVVLDYIENHAELKTEKNNDDMLNYLVHDDMEIEEDEEEW